jgi:hypothetical protein
MLGSIKLDLMIALPALLIASIFGVFTVLQ